MRNIFIDQTLCGESMNSYQDGTITRHLITLIQELERKLAYPKNDWRRKEQLHTELVEAKNRLKTLSSNNSVHNPILNNKTRLHREHVRGEEIKQISICHESSTRVAQVHPKKLEVNYR